MVSPSLKACQLVLKILLDDADVIVKCKGRHFGSFTIGAPSWDTSISSTSCIWE